MMYGYEKQEALAYMMKRIHETDHPDLAGQIESLLSQAIDADMAYMREAGVLDEEGYAGEGYYEDDDAFEAIVEALVEANDLSADQAVKVASLVAEYMDLQQAYLERKGLVDWES